MSNQPTQSNLFLIRMWVDQDGTTHGEWHGKVQHMNSSQASSFDDWATLKEVLTKMLDAGQANHSETMPDEANVPDLGSTFQGTFP
ncbi:MAG TPA: hypothetical protein VJ183_03885 [Chloroflexia bacterium]|nr:hypothetical protein [Chloroflexia bacterium]